MAVTPLVSVIICTRNRLPLLRQAVASVRAQTFRDYELVVVDDASSDGTRDWVRRAAPEARFERLSRRAGPPGARNRGLAAARGRLVAFLDSDDLWRPRYLEKLAPVALRPGVQLVSCDLDVIDARGRLLREKALRGVPFFLPSTIVCRRSAIDKEGGFDEGFRELYDDYDLWCRIEERWSRRAFRFVDEALVRYRRHGSQQTDKLQSRQARLDFALFAYRRAASRSSVGGMLIDSPSRATSS